MFKLIFFCFRVKKEKVKTGLTFELLKLKYMFLNINPLKYVM